MSGNAKCWRRPGASAWRGGFTPNPEQPSPVSSRGSASAVPCARPLACARRPRRDKHSQRWPACGPRRPRAADHGMNPAPKITGLDQRPGPHWENPGPRRQDKTMMMSRMADRLAGDFGTLAPDGNRHWLFTFDVQTLETGGGPPVPAVRSGPSGCVTPLRSLRRRPGHRVDRYSDRRSRPAVQMDRLSRTHPLGLARDAPTAGIPGHLASAPAHMALGQCGWACQCRIPSGHGPDGNRRSQNIAMRTYSPEDAAKAQGRTVAGSATGVPSHKRTDRIF